MLGLSGYSNFLQNKGQWPDQVLFGYSHGNVSYFIEKDGITIDLMHPFDVPDLHSTQDFELNKPIRKHALKLEWTNSSWKGELEIGKQLPGYTNWMIGQIENHVSQMLSFEEFVLKDVWDGIDIRFYINNESIKYDYIIHKGVSLDKIKYSISGAESIEKVKQKWHIMTSCGVIMESLPLAYQILDDGEITPVDCSFEQIENQFYFQTTSHDSSKNLIIDPELIVASYVGATQGVIGNAVGFGSDYFPNGDILVTAGCSTSGVNYPITNGAYTIGYGESKGAGISRFSADGNQLIWSTVLAGFTINTRPYATLCQDGTITLLLGIKYTPEYICQDFPQFCEFVFPTTSPTLIPDPFNVDQIKSYLVCAVLKDDGTSLLSSRSLSSVLAGLATPALTNGVGSLVYCADLKKTSDGDLVILFSTDDENVPITENSFDTSNSAELEWNTVDAVVMRISSNLETLKWCSFFGGNKQDYGFSLLLDAQDNPIIAGASESSSVITTEGAWMSDPPLYGDYNGFIAKLSNNGQELLTGTHVGFSVDLINASPLSPPNEPIRFIDFGPDSCIWAYGVGINNSSDILITEDAYSNPTARGMLCKFSPDLSELLVSSRVGFSGQQRYAPCALMVDNCGYIYTAANSAPEQGPPTPGWIEDAPLTEDAYQDSGGFYMAVYEPDLAGLHYATLLGGDHIDGSHSKFDKKGVVYQTVCVPPFEIGFNPTENAWSSESFIDWEAGFYKFDFESPASTAVLEVTRLDSTDCPPYIFQLENFSTEGEVSWFIDNEEITPDEDGLVSLNQSGWIELSLAVFNPETCNQTDTVRQLIQLPAPELLEADWSIDLSDLCEPDGGVLSVVFTGQNASDFQWETWNGSFSGNESLSIEFDEPGQYEISLLVSESVCSSSEELHFEFDYDPFLFSSGVIGSNPCILPVEMNGYFYGYGADHFSWFINGELVGTDSSYFTTLDQGFYEIEFIAESDECGSVAVQSELTVSGTVEVEILEDDLIICQGDELSFLANLNLGTGKWQVNGEEFSGNNLDYVFNQSGSLDIYFIGTDSLTCNVTASDSITISVVPRPIADFELQYTPNLCASEAEIQLEFTGSNASSFSWDMGDASFYQEENPLHVYQSSGAYMIELTVENPPCSAVTNSQLFEIILLGEAIELDLESINIISPNGDEINDCLQFFTEETANFVSDFKLRVFNRWGTLVYQSQDATSKWCPTDITEGSYFYILEFFDQCEGTTKELERSLTISR